MPKCFSRIFFETPENVEETRSKPPAVVQRAASPVHRPGPPARRPGRREPRTAALRELRQGPGLRLLHDALPLHSVLQVSK